MYLFGKQFINRHELVVVPCRYLSKKHKNLISLLLEMPKDTSHTAALKSQRLKGKNKSLKYTPGTVNLQVLGSGANGAPRCLYMFTDHSRYMFNCGEGSQRLAHEHKMKLSKLEHIFVTHSSWENVGGLPGVALTIQDVGVPEISLHGPEGIGQIFSATRRFVILKNMAVNTIKCTKYDHYEDNVVKIQYVPLESTKKKIPDPVLDMSPNSLSDDKSDSLDDDIDYYAHERNDNNKIRDNKKRKSNFPASDSNKCVKVEEVSMCYICRLQPRPGALCLDKCVDKGVPPGPLLGLLKNGQDVVLNDGTVVYSKDVTLPNDVGPVFIVLEVPSEEFLPALENEKELFSKYQESAESQDDFAFAVFHFTPTDIMMHPIYVDFMKKFPPSTHHILLNDSNKCLGSTAVHRIQYKLNMLDSNIFPLLADDSMPVKGSNDQVSEQIIEETKKSEIMKLKRDLSIANGRTLWKASLRPSRFIDSCEDGLTIDPKEYIDEVNNVEGFETEYNLLKDNLNIKQSTISGSNNNDEYPNLVFLGTGSCIPNKTRNTSAILLNICDESSILLDCGEGTLGQLYRFYGSEDLTNKLLNKLKAIYVSHLHADHHIGLIGILKARLSINSSNPLYLIAPHQISYWLNLYNKNFETIFNRNQFHLIPNIDLLTNSVESEKVIDLMSELNLKRLETCRVIHCPNSFGIALTHNQDWKITYSGDTMPCQDLINIGMSSDVLIHEATMEDELENEAKQKLHSTTSQAIESGRLMEAKFTLLTHFSQRYAKLPRISESVIANSNIGIAFDNMKVRLCDLPKLPLLYPCLKYMFREDCEDLEERAFKRQMKLERLKKGLAAS